MGGRGVRRTEFNARPGHQGFFAVPLADRLFNKFESGGADECWPWKNGLNSDGYGTINIAGRTRPATRVVYETLVGPIPPGMQLDHRCHSDDLTCPGGRCPHRSCVNPLHLEPVAARVNTLRGRGPTSANARKTHCPQGHPYTEENTRLVQGKRNCRECQRAADRRYKARKKAS